MDRGRRNTFFTFGAIALGYIGFRTIPSLLPEKLDLKPLAEPGGFRSYSAGPVSGGFDPFVGIGSTTTPEQSARRSAANRRARNDPCGLLYAGLDLSGGKVPVASFSDYYCPYCRIQTKHLADMVRNGEGNIAVAWHELPLLGEGSKLAAKAALAAKRQGAYPEFHARLMRSPFQPTPEYLDKLARDLGIDSQRLIADMNSPEVVRELDDSAALARLFGFVGTPDLAIGRTVVQGEISNRAILQIVQLEREEGGAAECRSI